MSVNTADLMSQGPHKTLIQAPDTQGWYSRQFGCLRSDPTLIARRHTFPDATLLNVIPDIPATPVRFADLECITGGGWSGGQGGVRTFTQLQSTWSSQRIGCELYQSSSALGTPQFGPETVAEMMETERNHPQFAFRAGAPITDHQIQLESQLRCIDRPLGTCNQGTLPLNGPLFRNDVAPPTPVGVPENVQNACNPQAAMIRTQGGCRAEEDRIASAASSRRFNNPTRLDTSQLPTLSR